MSAHVLPPVIFLHRISYAWYAAFFRSFDINAGLLVGTGDPNADVIDLSMHVKDLQRVLFASGDVLVKGLVDTLFGHPGAELRTCGSGQCRATFDTSTDETAGPAISVHLCGLAALKCNTSTAFSG